MTSAHVYIKEQAHNTIDEKTVYTIHTRMCQMFKHNRIKSLRSDIDQNILRGPRTQVI